MITVGSCAWCGRSFMARRSGGKSQRFCGATHRWQFWGAARDWAARAVEAGFVSYDDLKHDPAEFFGRGAAIADADGGEPRRGESPSQRNAHVPATRSYSHGVPHVRADANPPPPFTPLPSNNRQCGTARRRATPVDRCR